MTREVPENSRGIVFKGHEVKYFEWSHQKPPPEIWEKIEKPALEREIKLALEALKEIDPDNNYRVLDVGVGAGKVLGLMKELGFSKPNLTGIDINPKMSDLVRTIDPEIDLRIHDISDPFVIEKLSDKAPLSLIIAHMVLNHLDDTQLSLALSNIYGLLDEGGYFIGLVPYPGLPHRIEALHDSECGYWSEEVVPWGGKIKYRHRSFGAYHEYLELSGFITRVTTIMAESLPNRIIILGHKHSEFKNYQKSIGLDTKVIKRRK